MANSERTFIAIKPDGVQRSLVGEIIKRFEQKGFRLIAMKLIQASEDLLKEHYIDLKDRPFFAGLGPSVGTFASKLAGTLSMAAILIETYIYGAPG